ncbi:MAG: NADH:ubiquinone reductase (Na(+)-transporting) subunit C [Deferribacterales bacterium]
MKETKSRIFIVSLAVALFFSLVVSSTVAILKEKQDRNIKEDRLKHILTVAGDFKKMKILLLDLKTDEYRQIDNDVDFYNRFRTLSTGKDAIKLTKDNDLIGVGSIPSRIPVYLFYDDGGRLVRVVFFIYGNGLWSTMYGFIGVEKDLKTIYGITFYDQKETPGLGGEVDNPNWKMKWKGKKIFKDDGELALKVGKNIDNDIYTVDGLSGATMTTKGVDNIIKFWFGENGYGRFLKKLSEVKDGDL